MSKVESLILSKDFSYFQPYFYNHKSVLRCSLGLESIANAKKYLKSAYDRALEIYNIIFPNGADALFFDYLVTDDLYEGAEEDSKSLDGKEINKKAKEEAERIQFLYSNLQKYRSKIVRNLELADYYDESVLKRHRVICYSDDKKFDYLNLIHLLVGQDFNRYQDNYETSFVSFENECIFSIYDDRGCDIFFADDKKFKVFYDKLKPFFLELDLKEMEERLTSL